MNKLLIKLILLLLLSPIYLEEIFVGEISVSGLNSIDENILFINAGLYPKEKYEDTNLNNKYEQKDELIVEVNKLYVKLLENEIKKYPEQYFWFHKKWNKEIY